MKFGSQAQVGKLSCHAAMGLSLSHGARLAAIGCRNVCELVNLQW